VDCKTKEEIRSEKKVEPHHVIKLNKVPELFSNGKSSYETTMI